MAKRRNFLGSLLIFLILLIMVALIVGAVFELAVTPKASSIEDKYNKDGSDTYVAVSSGEVLGVHPGRGLAKAALLTYGYSNDSITDKIDTFVLITYQKKEGDQTITYTACVIYFDSIGDAMTARKGVKDKLKEDDKVSMFRGKTLVMGDQKAVLKYYYVLV